MAVNAGHPCHHRDEEKTGGKSNVILQKVIEDIMNGASKQPGSLIKISTKRKHTPNQEEAA